MNKCATKFASNNTHFVQKKLTFTGRVSTFITIIRNSNRERLQNTHQRWVHLKSINSLRILSQSKKIAAHKQWIWQYVFPASAFYKNPETSNMRRHHTLETALQKAVRAADHAAKIDKPVSPHTFRHYFASHLLEAGFDIRTVQELLGHKDVKTTMINTHMLNRRAKAVRSPLD